MLRVSQIKESTLKFGVSGYMDWGGPYTSSVDIKPTKEGKRELVKERFEELMAMDDNTLRHLNNYLRATNPVQPMKSGDDLYRRLEEVKGLARNAPRLDVIDVKLYGFDFIENIQIRMEERRMGKEEYEALAEHETAQDLYSHLRKLAS